MTVEIEMTSTIHMKHFRAKKELKDSLVNRVSLVNKVLEETLEPPESPV